MEIHIIGNGVAGTFAAQNIRNQNKDAEIHIYSEESYNYYTRIKLPEIISEKKTLKDLIVFKEEWYQNNDIITHLNVKVTDITPNDKYFTIEGGEKIHYDKLILAIGSHPNIPPIENAKDQVGNGLFTLRNYQDALEIRKYIKDKKCKKAIIIGGGLLGLELSKQIKSCGLDTRVVEFFPRLLPKQLDYDCAGMLKKEVEEMGIEVELDAKTERILNNQQVEGIKLKNGVNYEADIIFIQAGVKPNIELAQQADLKTNRGIIVDKFLQTSAQDIYAVGDCIEFEGQTWGIIPACIEQAKIVGNSVLGIKAKKYTGTTPQNTLKIIGIDLTSMGVHEPEELGGGWEILKKKDKTSNCYQKIVLKDNKLKGAILFGKKDALSFINKNIESEVNPEEIRKALEAYIFKCSNCGAEYDEVKKGMAFEDLTDDWECPKCGSLKDDFEKIN
jgi:nitrite reductase (NADH) large subunit